MGFNSGSKGLIRHVTTYGAEYWTVKKDIAKLLADFLKKRIKKNVWGELHSVKIGESDIIRS